MVSAMTSYDFWATFDCKRFPIDDQSIHEDLTCLFIVCETMFTIGESKAISYANGTEQQTQERRIQQPLLWSENADLKFEASNQEGDGSKKQRSRENITQLTSNAKVL